MGGSTREVYVSEYRDILYEKEAGGDYAVYRFLPIPFSFQHPWSYMDSVKGVRSLRTQWRACTPVESHVARELGSQRRASPRLDRTLFKLLLYSFGKEELDE